MSKDNDDLLKNLLTSNGYSLTKARVEVFRLLKSPKPQTISDILAKTKGTIDRVSVYRNLELFEKLGIVHRLYIGWKYKYELTDKFTTHHHHLTCLKCGKIIDIQDEKHINTFISQVSNDYGFQPTQHQFEIEGYCRDCLKEIA